MNQDGLPFHLSSLDFDISLDNLDLLSSQQLALVQFHSDATDDSISKAEILFWRRRQRDQYLLHVDALVDIGSLDNPESVDAQKTVQEETSVTQDRTEDKEARAQSSSALAAAESGDVAVDIDETVEADGEHDQKAQKKAPNAETVVAELGAASPEPSTSALPAAKAASPVIVVKEEPEEDIFPSESITSTSTPVQQPSRKGKERETSREEGEASPDADQPPTMESEVSNGHNIRDKDRFVQESKTEASRANAPRQSPVDGKITTKATRKDATSSPGGGSGDRTSKKRRRSRSRSDSRDRGRRRKEHRDANHRRSRSGDGRYHDKERNRRRRRSRSYSSYSSYYSTSYTGSSSSCSGSSSSYSSSSRSRSRSRSYRRRRERPDRQRSRSGRAPARIPSPEGSPDRTEMARKYRGQVSQPEMLAPRGRSASRPNGHISPPRPIQNNYGFPSQSGPGPSGSGYAAQGSPGQHQQYQQSVPAPVPSNEPKPPISIRGRSLPPQDMAPPRLGPSASGSIYSSRPQPAKWALPPRPGFAPSSSLTNTGPRLKRMGSIYK